MRPSATAPLLADLEALKRDGTAAKLAELVIAELATSLEGAVALRCVCGGTAWWPGPDGTAERCIACGEWSPCSTGVGGRR